MVRLVKALLCFMCTFAYAADGLILYTDPDFPEFSFEYDPLVWTIEEITPNDPYVLKQVIVKNLNGEQLIFHFEAF